MAKKAGTTNPFAFDAEKFSEMFKFDQFTKMFETAKIPGVDPDAIMAAQRKNMDALVEANKAAAAGYQTLFTKQVSIFETHVAELQKNLTTAGENALTSEGAQKNADLVKTAFEKALKDMTELAEVAKQANAETFAIVEARVKESIDELRTLAA